MPSILFLDVEETDRASVRAAFPDVLFGSGSVSEKELIAECQDAEVISTFITKFPRSIIDELPKLKLLCTRTVGYDHIDVDACNERGIVVCNVPDYGSHVIAEHVFALVLSTVRHISAAHERVTQGAFDYHGLRGVALLGKTIGIVGTGHIGRRVAHIAHGFGMNILATDQCRTAELETELGVTYVDLETLLKSSDIVTLHVPATKETNHMLNNETFRTMKTGAILVNTARGSLIDSHALLEALENKKIAWALLDVMEHEGNFEENKKLIKHPNVVATPHIAFYADDSMKNMFADSIQSIREWQEGKEPQHILRPLNVVCDLPKIQAKH